MINIRPVSDLRNRFPEIENDVLTSGDPVFLTKNGYGSMVLLSLEQYAALTDPIESALVLADAEAGSASERFTAEEVFGRVRRRINDR